MAVKPIPGSHHIVEAKNLDEALSIATPGARHRSVAVRPTMQRRR